ncbi:MAG: LysR family transcriptional regulator, partial [Granulosicoccus sp.]|nr:LysR family transcriptional regulator [Granulosicoccus sp.]
DLLKHNCLTHSSIQHFNDWEFATSDGVRVQRVKGNFHTNSASALHEAVKAGIGIARLATYVVQPSLEAGLVIPLLKEHAVDSSTIQLVYPHRRHLSNKVRVFTDFMVGKFTPNPPWERAG